MNNSVEKIIFRSVIVISLLSFLLGISMIIYGAINADDLKKLLRSELEKNSQAYTSCTNISEKVKDDDEIMFCKAFFGPNMTKISIFEERQGKAEILMVRGIWVSLISPSLFFLFYIVRWVFTGRWKDFNR